MGADRRAEVAALVDAATSGAVTAEAALAAGAPLFDLGLDSLGWLRLIDAVESRYGLDLQADGADLRLVTVDGIAELLAVAATAQEVPPPPLLAF
ncbi:phosphopantetheine-binding protein [Dactylosporangium sp. NPDC051541]|uniref:phosphopantetheine-binding protein n=1 Tax=Dactylosporangium sp. NPDC051541 TaxID=3363977 RepID=UPI0037ACBBF9